MCFWRRRYSSPNVIQAETFFSPLEWTNPQCKNMESKYTKIGRRDEDLKGPEETKGSGNAQQYEQRKQMQTYQTQKN